LFFTRISQAVRKTEADTKPLSGWCELPTNAGRHIKCVCDAADRSPHRHRDRQDQVMCVHRWPTTPKLSGPGAGTQRLQHDAPTGFDAARLAVIVESSCQTLDESPRSQNLASGRAFRLPCPSSTYRPIAATKRIWASVFRHQCARNLSKREHT